MKSIYQAPGDSSINKNLSIFSPSPKRPMGRYQTLDLQIARHILVNEQCDAICVGRHDEISDVEPSASSPLKVSHTVSAGIAAFTRLLFLMTRPHVAPAACQHDASNKTLPGLLTFMTMAASARSKCRLPNFVDSLPPDDKASHG